MRVRHYHFPLALHNGTMDVGITASSRNIIIGPRNGGISARDAVVDFWNGYMRWLQVRSWNGVRNGQTEATERELETQRVLMRLGSKRNFSPCRSLCGDVGK